ncbi:MAG TPA: cobaltochelatase subunit CobN, partial [Acidimicrobiales bacterium]|nr:cobaltochelatase subunit CobN [Acidimicrobiales bacterium]
MILYLSNAPTELLALRSIVEGMPADFPEIRAADPSALAHPPSLDGVGIVMVRLLGGAAAWPGLAALAQQAANAGVPLLAFGGEAAPDAEMTAASTVPSATVAQAFEYLVHGGLPNMEQMLRFVSDTVAMTGFGFEPPAAVPTTGVLYETAAGDGPLVAVLFYRAHLIAGNTLFVEDLCGAIEDLGGRAVAVWAYSLRPDHDGRVEALDLLEQLRPAAAITTVLVSGTAADDGLAWDASALGVLDVPVLQAITATSPSSAWQASTAGLSPVDVAMRVAIPEFDGRIVSVPFSFNEVVDEGDSLGTAVTAYRTVPDRVRRVAGTALRLARLRSIPVAERRVAIVMSAYPTRRSRIGNAVALDTPASVVALLEAMRAAGYRIDRIPDSGDALMAELIDAFAYEEATLTDDQLRQAPGRWGATDYERWWQEVPPGAAAAVEAAWGPAPGSVYRDPA